jgi:integrase
MNVFRRKGRPTFYFQARTRSGYKQLSTRSSDKRVAREIATAWNRLSIGSRAWDVLDPVLDGRTSITALFDAYRDSKGDIEELRFRLNDVDLTELVSEYLRIYSAGGRKEDTLQHVKKALTWLLPPGSSLRASGATTDWLTQRLAEYPASDSTRRKIHSEWRGFFDYVVQVKRIMNFNPMLNVRRPSPRRPGVEFYELDEAMRIIGHQPTPERAALMAFCYGTGVEISTALRTRRSDLDPAGKMVRAVGTKTATRDRIVRVDDWAWSYLWRIAQNKIGQASIFPEGWTRWTASDWHRETVIELGLAQRYPLKNARHHWAATHLRGGYPIYEVQRQLGHASPQLTLTVYGRFIPSAVDVDGYQERYKAHAEARRSAAGGAK